MFYQVVIEVEKSEGVLLMKCYNIVFQAPEERFNDNAAFDGCVMWIENNQSPGSKYAIIKMYIHS